VFLQSQDLVTSWRNFGIKFSNDNDFRKSIDKSRNAILHAPLFHPAMKNVGPIRKELAVKPFQYVRTNG
jgi:anthranilate phosphoribosyltransferase